MPNAAQINGIGIESTPVAFGAGAGVLSGAAGAFVMMDGAGDLAVGTVSSGCVLLIFTAGAAAGPGSGRMLMRAVSFFGPGWAADPG